MRYNTKQLSSSDASDVINSVLSDSYTANDSSLSEPEIGGGLNGSLHQIIEAGCYCTIKVYSSDGKFKLIVEVVLRGPGDYGDFEVNFLKRSNNIRNEFVFPDRDDIAFAKSF